MSYAFPCSGKLGAKFKRDMKQNSSEQKTYSELVGHKAKAKFRIAWAAMRMESITRTTRKEEEHKRVELLQGEYVPFKVLWDRQGNDLSGYRAPI